MFDKSIKKKQKGIKMHLLQVLMVLVLLYLSGCSTTNNYKFLSFFFDGVPDPANSATTQVSDSLNNPDSLVLALNQVKAAPQMQMHSPYQDKKCNSCHDQNTMGKLIKSMPGLCYQCHEDFNTRYKVVHGPVEGGQCSVCHSPHMSLNADLLLRTGQSQCLHCHESAGITQNIAHRDINDRSCTECHNPHGGDDRNFLR